MFPVADHQKTTWRRRKDDKEHDEKFITGGLWSISRHPKYVIEILVLSIVGSAPHLINLLVFLLFAVMLIIVTSSAVLTDVLQLCRRSGRMDRHLGLVNSLFMHVFRSPVNVADRWNLSDHNLFPAEKGLGRPPIGGEWASFLLHIGFRRHTIVCRPLISRPHHFTMVWCPLKPAADCDPAFLQLSFVLFGCGLLTSRVRTADLSDA